MKYRGVNRTFFFLISVGAPLKVNRVENPTKEEVENLHSLYVAALRELFDKHKKNYGIAEDEHLEIIWLAKCTG